VAKFPVDAPLDRVLRAMGVLGFQVVRSGNHISLARTEAAKVDAQGFALLMEDLTILHITRVEHLQPV
jgi:hypothetical protein